MDEFIKVNGRSIRVQLKLHAIKIWNDETLSAILKMGAEESTRHLTNSIKIEYYKLFNSDFEVSNDSITVEIWAHVYAEKFAEAVKNFSSLKLVDAFADKILEHAEIIDIGEKGHDDNRFIWDGLAPFKSTIANVLFSQHK